MTTNTEDPIVTTVREAIRRESLDRFASDFITEDGRDWIAGFAARAAVNAMEEAGYVKGAAE